MLPDSQLASTHVGATSVILAILTDPSARRLLRAWALWNRRRDIGIFFISLCCGAAVAVITTVRSTLPVSMKFLTRPLMKRLTIGLKPLPRVAPLPPPSVLPCERPSLSKYVVAYSIALIVEGTSLVFMLGRVVWLGSGIKRDAPILQALKAQ